MRLYLINPCNPLVSILKVKESRWNRYRVWKPLSLMVLAGLTPPEWETSILDENLGVPDYSAMPRPDLVGITAFTSQAKPVPMKWPITFGRWVCPSSWAAFTPPCVSTRFWKHVDAGRYQGSRRCLVRGPGGRPTGPSEAPV